MAVEDLNRHVDMVLLDWMVPVVLIVVALPFGLLVGALLADAVRRKTASAFAALVATVAFAGALGAVLLWALPGDPLLTARVTTYIRDHQRLPRIRHGPPADRPGGERDRRPAQPADRPDRAVPHQRRDRRAGLLPPAPSGRRRQPRSRPTRHRGAGGRQLRSPTAPKSSAAEIDHYHLRGGIWTDTHLADPPDGYHRQTPEA